MVKVWDYDGGRTEPSEAVFNCECGYIAELQENYISDNSEYCESCGEYFLSEDIIFYSWKEKGYSTVHNEANCRTCYQSMIENDDFIVID